MRAVPLLSLCLFAGCIASEPGKGTSQRQIRACSELEGAAFANGSTQRITFSPDDADYSTYEQTTAESTQTGLVQCEVVGSTTLLYVDVVADRHNARVDYPNSAGGPFLSWTDGATLVAE
jgi:hypothetical protein